MIKAGSAAPTIAFSNAPREARLKVSSTFSKVAGSRGGAPGRAPQSAEPPLCLFKRRRGSKGEPSPGVPPFLCVCTCASIRWEVVDGLSCDSTPFLWCLPKETVSSRQRKALFLPRWLHHSRERSCLGGRGSSSPDLGEGAGTCAPFCWAVDCGPYCPFHPISLLLRKETGWSPKETRFWVPPRDMYGPARLSHELEAPTSQPTASS